MRTNEMRKRPELPRRGAFTLAELLVVIAIMVALVALTASVVARYMVSGQESTTRAILDKTQIAVSRAWVKVKDEVKDKPMTEIVPGTTMTVGQWIQTNLASNAGNPSDPNIVGRARVIYVKLWLRRAFPMNFNEALNPFPLPPLAGYVTFLTSLGITGTTGNLEESSACLLMALQRGVSGAGVNPNDLAGGNAMGSLPTPNGGVLPFLKDAWGKPIIFTRVPAGSAQLNTNPYPGPPGPGQPGANDPLDPQGYLQAAGWARTGAGVTPQAQLFTALTLQQLAGPDMSYMLAPMLCSSGMNQLFETDPITFANPNPVSDDLYSKP